MPRGLLIKATSLLLALFLGVCLAELTARILGRGPWVSAQLDRNEPTMHERDPVLGWRVLPGEYRVPPYQPDAEPIEMTFLEGGRRRTGARPVAGAHGDILLVGDSFTQGWAINDPDTYAWKLQSSFPKMQVLNYGTAGYSSYQSLLLLERELPRSVKPRLVMYGFNDFHEERNVALDFWLRTLVSFSRRGHASVPYATYDAQRGLVRHAPDTYVALPLRESSALIALVESGYMRMKTRGRAGHQRVVTEQVILQMAEVAKAYRATLIVALLTASDEAKGHYINFLKRNGILAVDCAFELTEDMKVPGEGHPNGEMNTRWAACIAAGLATRVDSLAEQERQ
jgi:hypothetical protein